MYNDFAFGIYYITFHKFAFPIIIQCLKADLASQPVNQFTALGKKLQVEIIFIQRQGLGKTEMILSLNFKCYKLGIFGDDIINQVFVVLVFFDN